MEVDRSKTKMAISSKLSKVRKKMERIQVASLTGGCSTGAA